MTENQKLREALQAVIAAHDAEMKELGERMHAANLKTLRVDIQAAIDMFSAIEQARQALALPTADHIPDTGEKVVDHLPNAGKMINGLTQAETDASASVSGLTGAPVGERELFENEMRHVDVWGHRSLKKRASGNYENWQVNLMWDVWQARAALSAGDAVDAQRWRYAMDWGTKDFAVCMRVGATGVCWEPIKTDGPIDAAMRKGQL